MPLKRLIQRNLVTSRDQFSDFAKGKAANLVSRFANGKATREALQCSQQKTPHDSQTQNVRLDLQEPARVPSSLPAPAPPSPNRPTRHKPLTPKIPTPPATQHKPPPKRPP